MYFDKTAEFSYLISRSLHFYIEDKDYLNFMGSCSHENREQNSNLNGRARFLLEQTSQRLREPGRTEICSISIIWTIFEIPLVTPICFQMYQKLVLHYQEPII